MAQASAFRVGPGQGEALWTLNTYTRILAGEGSTGGSLGAWEWLGTAAGNPPLHVHEKEDEAFYLLEGEVAFEVGGASIAATQGDLVFAPRGLPHRFAVRSPQARMLVIAVPGGFERFFVEVGRRAETHGVPPMEELDPGRLADAAAPYGVEILGPPVGT